MSFDKLPICILQYISDNYLKFYDIITFSQVNKQCHKIRIKDFWNISYILKNILKNNILINYKYLEKLYLACNKNVTNLNYLENLKELDISNCPQIKNNHIEKLVNLETLCLYDENNMCIGNCISNDGIKYLTKLKMLNVNGNRYITELDHLVNLQVLHAGNDPMYDFGFCAINNTSIKNLTNLTELDIQCNEHVNDISSLTNLKILNACASNIDDKSIKYMTKLVKLDISQNEHITNIFHLVNLKTLKVINDSGVDNDINYLTNLTELNISSNKSIKNINNLINLNKLTAKFNSDIDNDSINSLTNLTELNISQNNKITNIDHIVKLKKLSILYNSGIDNDINKFTNLTELDVSFNKNITNLNNLINLNKLTAKFDSVNKESIKNLNIKELIVDHNNNFK